MLTVSTNGWCHSVHIIISLTFAMDNDKRVNIAES